MILQHQNNVLKQCVRTTAASVPGEAARAAEEVAGVSEPHGTVSALSEENYPEELTLPGGYLLRACPSRGLVRSGQRAQAPVETAACSAVAMRATG